MGDYLTMTMTSRKIICCMFIICIALGGSVQLPEGEYGMRVARCDNKLSECRCKKGWDVLARISEDHKCEGK